MAGTIRVLQVDDEPDFLELSATLLERADDDLDVVTVDSGEAALDRLLEGDVDCVISDYDMPRMDGLDLLREVDADYSSTPFILLTARGSEEVASEAISAGVDDYLQKGGGDEQYQLLANRIRNLVRQSRAMTSYREIFENATVGLTVRDTESGELIDANERYCELLGYSKEELLELDLGDLSATEEGYTSDLGMELIRDAGDGHVETFEWLDRTSDDELLWVEVSLRQAEIEGEERVLASVQDITERKSHEQTLAETREYYETAAANLPNASVAIYDDELRYEFVDGGIFSQLTVDPADMTGETLTSFHSEQYLEATLEHYEAALEGEQRTFDVEIEGRTHRAHTLPVTDDGSVMSGMAVTRDVTDLRERQRRLEQLASLLNHDLRNPLSIASGAVELAREDGDTAPLEDATAALDRIEQILQDALDLAGMDARPDEFEPVALDAVAREAWASVETGEAELVVRDGRQIRADATGLWRLYENLFDNAVEHGDARTITVESIEGGFAVEDDGQGIPTDEHDAIFETGFTTHPEGTGLGLAIVERIADVHDWRVRATDSETGGARFEVTSVETLD